MRCERGGRSGPGLTTFDRFAARHDDGDRLLSYPGCGVVIFFREHPRIRFVTAEAMKLVNEWAFCFGRRPVLPLKQASARLRFKKSEPEAVGTEIRARDSPEPIRLPASYAT